MPRPKRPGPPSPILAVLSDDDELDAVVGLYAKEPDYRLLKREVQRLIDAYLTGWTPGRAPGRRREQRRNDLLVALARVFHARTGWIDPHEYRHGLYEFLTRVLIARGIFSPTTRLPRLIPPHLRIPR